LSLRSYSLPRHGRRALVASSLTAALVFVPGVAAAEDPTDLGSGVTETLEEVTGELEGGELEGGGLEGGELEGGGLEGGELEGGELEGGGLEGGELEGGGLEGGELEGGELEGGELEGDPSAELAALLEGLGLPEGCVSSFQGVIEGLAGELAELPEEAPEVLTGLVAGLQEAFENQDPAALDAALEELLGADVLAQLEEALTACLPVEEEPEKPAPVAPVGGGTPQAPAPAPAPAPHAPQPVAQPVAYLGYAPTGADTARADDTSVPLTALGGGLVLVAAGAAGYGMRGRAVRTRD
jgi:hypothetical protein